MLNAAFYEPIASHQRFIAALPLMSNLIVSLNLFIALIEYFLSVLILLLKSTTN